VFDEIARPSSISASVDSRPAISSDRRRSAFNYQKRLDGLPGLTEADRITVNRIKQLQSAIHVDYSFAMPISISAGRGKRRR